ncbi:hypothetical protein [Thalassobaculum litoreum]|uniref:Uncharacterized protein n=1 Tax=Thalassobaculum litoreum DSM 18839 TaxID=1123362 RepID=A0A8G2BKN3_9PROT|nr:hypothetical protein [Thalassobaculum litoreum]SDF83619.1 hypothetical protein SAMN05660686_02474 [Thalassobaculum litoreum DSM 18839]
MRNLTQTVTRWAPTGTDAAGDPIGYTRTEILGRWEESQQLFTRSDGTEAVSRAIVYLASDVAVGDFLLQGSSVSASPPSTAWRVEAFRKVENLRGTDSERRAML